MHLPVAGHPWRGACGVGLAASGGPEVVGYWGERADPAVAAELGARGLAGDLFADGAPELTSDRTTPFP